MMKLSKEFQEDDGDYKFVEVEETVVRFYGTTALFEMSREVFDSIVSWYKKVNE